MSLLVLFAALAACHAGEPMERRSEHFAIVADARTSDEVKLREGVARAESLYAAVAAVVPERVTR